MSVALHTKNRAWAFQSLDRLAAFLADPDFAGDAAAELDAIQKQREDLRNGKYRIVFIGAFNVGKSTLVNAFLGDEYLPTILEECTAKVSQILRGDAMRLLLRLTAPVTEAEVQALRDFLAVTGIPCVVSLTKDGARLRVQYERPTARALLTTLRVLITFSADQDFPQLRGLRAKFDEVAAYLPTNAIEPDIAFVDSPGVHSISETGEKVTRDVIPNCHLVVCMLDSQTAGTEQNRGFIEDVVKQRHRKIMFVVNKSDQLNPEEIDVTGHRGPAKDLLRGITGIVDKPEIFFVSSLYATLSQALAKGKLTLEEVDRNNKVKIPFGDRQVLQDAPNPPAAAADYLMEASQFPALHQRVYDYLYRENKDGAVVSAACRFAALAAERYARPLETRLELLRNAPRLEELQNRRRVLESRLRDAAAKLEALTADLATMANGGTVQETDYEGFAAFVEQAMNRQTIETHVLQPLLAWLDDPAHIKEAKKARSKLLRQKIEQAVDQYLLERHQAACMLTAGMEAPLIDRMIGIEDLDVPESCPDLAMTKRAPIAVRAGLLGSYIFFGLAGAVLVGAACGAGAAWAVHTGQFPIDIFAKIQLPPEVLPLIESKLELLNYAPITERIHSVAIAVLCGAAGAKLGFLLGLVARFLGAGKKRVKRMRATVTKNIARHLILDGRKHLAEALAARRKSFQDEINAAFAKLAAMLRAELGTMEKELATLEKEVDDLAGRLEPKINALRILGNHAQRVAEDGSTVVEPPDLDIAAVIGDGADAEEAPQSVRA